MIVESESVLGVLAVTDFQDDDLALLCNVTKDLIEVTRRIDQSFFPRFGQTIDDLTAVSLLSAALDDALLLEVFKGWIYGAWRGLGAFSLGNPFSNLLTAQWSFAQLPDYLEGEHASHVTAVWWATELIFTLV